MSKPAFLWIILLFFLSCTNSTGNSKLSEESSNDDYPDGIYCATVEYYYSKTGTESTYTLKVEVEDGQLVKIYWPNGGWLDESHFTPPDITDGTASFESDREAEYEVTILGSEDNCSYDSEMAEQEEVLWKLEELQEQRRKKSEAAETCPRCYSYKMSWDKYCSTCEDELENTCRQCGGYAYGVYGGICDDCREDMEDDQENEY
jgi:hypothetical protein